MKLKETYTWFSGLIHPGNLAFFINIDKYGIETDIKELITQASTFNRVIIFGDEPFEQKNDIGGFIKKVQKLNDKTIFEIYTKGTIKPVLIGAYKNMIYNVIVQLKNTKIEYKDRIKESVLVWFNDIGANFIFFVENKDDIDEADMMIKNIGIIKRQVYLSFKDHITEEDLEMLINTCKILGYNFVIDFGKMFWPRRE